MMIRRERNGHSFLGDGMSKKGVCKGGGHRKGGADGGHMEKRKWPGEGDRAWLPPIVDQAQVRSFLCRQPDTFQGDGSTPGSGAPRHLHGCCSISPGNTFLSVTHILDRT